MSQSVERALSVLDALAQCDEGVGVLELARRVGLPNSTVHRILSVLKAREYVIQAPSTGRYGLGLGAVVLARSKLRQVGLCDLCMPCLTELRDHTGETAHLVVLEGTSAVCIASVESLKNMKMCSPVGGLNPLTCTSVGKILLAHAPPAIQASVLEQEPVVHTDRTITDRQEIGAELIRAKEDDLAFDREEYQIGVQCIAAPVRNGAGKVIAAVGVSFPVPRVDEDQREFFVASVQSAGKRLTRECAGMAVEA